KGIDLMPTTPRTRSQKHVCTPHQRLERLFDLFAYSPSAFLTIVRIAPDGSMRMELNLLQNNAASACDPIHTSRDTETSVSVHPNRARADCRATPKAPFAVGIGLTAALIGEGSLVYESSPFDSRTVESNGELSLKLIRGRG